MRGARAARRGALQRRHGARRGRPHGVAGAQVGAGGGGWGAPGSAAGAGKGRRRAVGCAGRPRGVRRGQGSRGRRTLAHTVPGGGSLARRLRDPDTSWPGIHQLLPCLHASCPELLESSTSPRGPAGVCGVCVWGGGGRVCVWVAGARFACQRACTPEQPRPPLATAARACRFRALPASAHGSLSVHSCLLEAPTQPTQAWSLEHRGWGLRTTFGHRARQKLQLCLMVAFLACPTRAPSPRMCLLWRHGADDLLRHGLL